MCLGSPTEQYVKTSASLKLSVCGNALQNYWIDLEEVLGGSSCFPYKEVSGRSDFYEINVVIPFKHFPPPSGLLASDFVYVIVSCETNETYADLRLR